ncbi:PSP1 domain-containing protein [Mariniplasma anaerobium]|uniref:Stage 0 sporulation protein n=1 Tax=Mariniplasma anaerobium TaxID=2735436 RepID=A0A7U9TKF7_9MOLU|nr:regulatory iron-sulfur-containing complex subunit RicT [Mariniplasma anaerobium]BCR35373.1 stage 0 sporulation protein [Mariniplasma anaerobium]
MDVALVQFKEAGKKYFFSYHNLEINQDDLVVVETSRGIEIGRVYLLKEIEESELTSELKPIIRLAQDEDMKEEEYNQTLEKGVVETAKKLSIKNELEMKILGAEYTLDRKRLLIYFEADSRVDFRGLVRDLSEIYHTRIELRQIGPRDAAKMIGGIGPCGLILCCTMFIGEFDTVSIKMAKNQNLALNPQKISGVCGKLLCCIKYEDEAYTELKKNLPDFHEIVEIEGEQVLVIDVNILGQKVKVKHQQEDFSEWVTLDMIKRIKA